MLILICGEDNVGSRNYFLSLKDSYKNKNYEITNIIISDLPEIDKWLSESVTLFGNKRVFFIENLNKKISKKSPNIYLNLIDKYIKDKNIEIIDWEDQTSSRELKITGNVYIKEFKPSKNIFHFLDSCYPKNLTAFLQLSNTLSDNIDDFFIFTMLTRHIKNLIYANNDNFPKKLAGWQIAKLKRQANLWDKDKLVSFYDGLYRIDLSTKTSTNPYSVKQSIDILATYYL